MTARSLRAAPATPQRAQIAITLDLEMSRHYPVRGMTEWDYQKGNLNEPTKQYALDAARIAKERGALIHYFCVGRVLEQDNVDWLKEIHELGHPIGNHTYDHVNVWATEPAQTQFRFQRSPWLIRGMSAAEIIQQNIRTTTMAMRDRLGFDPAGFRTPGGSYLALDDREDLQQMLRNEGFSWVSSKYPQHEYGTAMQPPTEAVHDSIVSASLATQPYVYPTGLVEVPMSPISDVGAFRTNYWKLDDFLESVRRCVSATIDRGLVFDMLMHPSIMYVEDPNFEAVKLVYDLVNDAGDRAEIVGLGTIAAAAQPSTPATPK
ncbi:MAG: polysaccharide deacetylase family protein [Planctomycetales bacterium]|nr:polysaccharide deacetylase family protein [Planctomycetales bacterium]